MILAKLRPAMGMKPGEEDLSPEEIKAQQEEQLQAEMETRQKEQALKEQSIMLELEEQKGRVTKLMAEAEKIMSEIKLKRDELGIKKEIADADNYTKGFKVGKEMRGGDAAYI